MINRLFAPLATLTAFTLVSACGAEFEFGATESSVAPAGSGATLISTTFPASFAPGERVNVQVVMQNSGAASPANDWNAGTYRFFRQSTQWAFGQVLINPTVVTGDTATFNFNVTAPATSPQDFSAQMQALAQPDVGFFGDVVSFTNIPITNAQRRWSCSFVSSNLPATLSAGQQQSVSVTVQNNGLNDWAQGQFCFQRRDNLGPSCVFNDAPVPAGAQHTFTFTITAPAAAGNYTLRRQVSQTGSAASGSVQLFDFANDCFNQTFAVMGVGDTYESEFVPAASNIDELTTMRTGETTSVTLTFRNSGTATWTQGDYLLYSRNTPRALWGNGFTVNLDADVPPNGTHTFTFAITAPAMAGNYAHQWSMFGTAPAPGFFGEQVNIPVVVSAAAPLQFDASIASTVMPPSIGQVQQGTFRVTVQNTGVRDWDADTGFRLLSVNTPSNLWGLAFMDVAAGVAVPSGGQYEFVLPIQSPANAGIYASAWRMDQSGAGGIGLFGATTTDMVEVVIDCGDGFVNVNIGEQCDDNNLTNGDGCSDTCQIETLRFDLGAGPLDRTLVSNQPARGLGNTGIGDLDNDGFDDLAAANWGRDFTITPVRRRSGVTFVHYGNLGFFDGAATGVDVNAAASIVGEAQNVEIGGGASGTVKIDDVTGDGIDDLILSGGLARCADDSTYFCGRVYVLSGGARLAGLVDLSATPSPWTARLIGENTNDKIRVITTGDVTGDGIADLIIGAPGAGGGRGEVIVVAGGPTLTGSRVLTAANKTASITGEGATDGLGLIAAVGQLGSSVTADLLLGSPGHTPALGGDRAGGAWLLFGPLVGTYDLSAGAWNARWTGAGIRDGLGASVAVGQVRGNATNEALIGVTGYRVGAQRFGSVDVYAGPILQGSDFDLAAGATADVVIQGEDVNDGYGHCLVAADLNSDNFDDIITANPFTQGSPNNLVQAGETNVILGADTLADQQVGLLTSPLVIYGPAAVSRACIYRHALSTGDLDGDGRPDICTGAPFATEPGFPTPQAGRVDCWRNRY